MTTLNKLIQKKSKEFDGKLFTDKEMQSFLSTAIQEGYELGLKDVIDMVKENREGSFTDDGGNDCWYIDELVKQLQLLLKKEKQK